ncbi:MAG: hypothetical protein EXR02_04310 [Rhodospirillales bacterium]|nr:hypothetical protein [Rhodospirillales bacterium]MSP80277.1 hypothetical protein [Rhodospirillales bacterium]
MALYTVLGDLDSFDAPWGKKIVVQKVKYEGGLTMLRVRIKEGSRFTLLDLDAQSARRLGQGLLAWADAP